MIKKKKYDSITTRKNTMTKKCLFSLPTIEFGKLTLFAETPYYFYDNSWWSPW